LPARDSSSGWLLPRTWEPSRECPPAGSGILTVNLDGDGAALPGFLGYFLHRGNPRLIRDAICPQDIRLRDSPLRVEVVVQKRVGRPPPRSNRRRGDSITQKSSASTLRGSAFWGSKFDIGKAGACKGKPMRERARPVWCPWGYCPLRHCLLGHSLPAALPV
jgi:hypothetical protein